ncbi:hypothetical protein M427DRAFT_59179 [Gonapodya prolifera JEL478]|uniref:SH3 domain-containing protein n=1 Tax=Gonapodya prolifera (strain JEL478) TaxID=1344416 RepID=A0A139A7T5_GONPJ|nr:hypothetical protein M427DRAFT_59179 [Gonapodya prolifera JEL478]|eukprot:KXS12871.1 hypothetical protein M427DRAFT_59179 [Gonapodya prolifera JEL478]
MLIEAIEAGAVEAVRLVLGAGVQPDVRKKVTLSVLVDGSRRQDSTEAETPLALAILYGRPDFVKLLIDAGASVRDPVGWKVPNWEERWVEERWRNGRWFATYTFESVLEVALCCPASISSPFAAGKERLETIVKDEQQLALNIDGSPALVTDPVQQKDAFHFMEMKPNHSVIKALLNGGAPVTDRCIDRAMQLGAEGEALVHMFLEATSAKNPNNSRLIEAVEARDVGRVRAALAVGASPDARKRTLLRASVEGLGAKSDVSWGESALALAILYGKAEIVEELLNAGADVHRLVEWRVPTWEDGTWNQLTWQKNRWLLTYRCASVIDLVVGTPRVSSANVDVRDEFTARAEQEGKFAMSKDGGEIEIVNPTTREHSFDFGGFICNIPILRLLLERGVQVSSSARRAARAMSDPAVSTLIEEHLKAVASGRAGSNPRIAPVENPAQTQMFRVLEAQITDVKQQLGQARSLAQQRIAHHNTLVNELERDIRAVEADSERLRAQVGEIRSAKTHNQLNQAQTRQVVNPSLNDIQHRVQNMNLNQTAVLYAFVEFTPREVNEIQLRVGDRVTCERQSGGWGQGRNLDTNQFGVYPVSYVSPKPTNPFLAMSASSPISLNSPLGSSYVMDVAGPPTRGNGGSPGA